MGDFFIIQEMKLEGVMRRRLLDLGFVKGAEIMLLQKSLLGDPMAFLLVKQLWYFGKNRVQKYLVKC